MSSKTKVLTGIDMSVFGIIIYLGMQYQLIIVIQNAKHISRGNVSVYFDAGRTPQHCDVHSMHHKYDHRKVCLSVGG